MVKQHYAFTLIELIFAIVLVAIIVAAVPQMLSQNSKGTEEYIKQEVIAAAAGEAFRIISYPWDTNSFDSGTNRSYVLDISGGSSNLNRIANTVIRTGHVIPMKGTGANAGNVERNFHRQFFTSNTAPANNKLSGASQVDSQLLTESGADAYKKVYNIVFPSNENGYISDGGGATTFNFPDTNASLSGNMKMATIQIDSTDSTGTTEANIMRIRVYAANIGTPEYYTREF
jgi:prepilin-type N-terminal cleavage/methylation domain-containing protein